MMEKMVKWFKKVGWLDFPTSFFRRGKAWVPGTATNGNVSIGCAEPDLYIRNGSSKAFPMHQKMPCFRFQGASISNFPSIDKTSLRHSQNQTTPVIQKSCYVSNTGNDTGQQQEKARIIGMPLLCQLGRGRTRGFFFRPPKKKNLVATWWFGGNEFLSCAKFEKHGGDVTKNKNQLEQIWPNFLCSWKLEQPFFYVMIWNHPIETTYWTSIEYWLFGVLGKCNEFTVKAKVVKSCKLDIEEPRNPRKSGGKSNWHHVLMRSWPSILTASWINLINEKVDVSMRSPWCLRSLDSFFWPTQDCATI